MYRVKTNDDAVPQGFIDLDDAEAYGSSKPLAIIVDEEKEEVICGYVNGTRVSRETVHSYPLTQILYPNGSFNPGSLSNELLKLFHNISQSWLDGEKFFDSTTPKHFIELLRKNASNELELALKRFELEILGEKKLEQSLVDDIFELNE